MIPWELAVGNHEELTMIRLRPVLLVVALAVAAAVPLGLLVAGRGPDGGRVEAVREPEATGKAAANTAATHQEGFQHLEDFAVAHGLRVGSAGGLTTVTLADGRPYTGVSDSRGFIVGLIDAEAANSQDAAIWKGACALSERACEHVALTDQRVDLTGNKATYRALEAKDLRGAVVGYLGTGLGTFIPSELARDKAWLDQRAACANASRTPDALPTQRCVENMTSIGTPLR